MNCDACKDVIERPDVPHVVRTCKGCGRELKIHEPRPHGKGLRIEKGDQVVIPRDWLRISLNPLKTTGQLSRYGVEWFAEQIHLEGLPQKRDDLAGELDRIQKASDLILENSELLKGMDQQTEEGALAAVELIKQNRGSREWWALCIGTYVAIVRDGLAAGDPELATWAMACAERCRSMLVFKEHLEEVVWMGQSARRIVDVLRIWDGNQTNADEGFWQSTFREHAYALAQVFAAALVFIKDAAYVGGMNVDRQNAKLVDYLYAFEASQEAVLIEIKTPATPLLGTKYRGTYRPSVELSGAVVQALDYRRTLLRKIDSVLEGTSHQVKAIAPKCVVIVGNGKVECNSPSKRDAFELFRGNSRDVEIVTYDELFRKLDVLAQLFSLSHATPPAAK